MIATIVVCGLGKTNSRDFKKTNVLSARAHSSYYWDFYFGPYEFLAGAVSRKMGQLKNYQFQK